MTETLHSNRKNKPKELALVKLKKEEHNWEVLIMTTKYHPDLLPVENRFGQETIKPKDVSRYKDNNSEFVRNDQMVNYYSSSS